MTAFSDALASIFGDANFGTAATYTPPAGSPTLCSVIRNSRDREPGGFSGRPVLQGDVIEVRKAEVALPVKGGVFVPGAIVAGVFVPGAESLTIQGDPTCEDPDRLVWTCTVN